MVRLGIVGYTPLNGHPYSFGCIINGFEKNIVINNYPQIENYLRKNTFYKNGIDGMQCTHIFCKERKITDNIAKKINALPIYSLSDFPKNLDMILVLCDHSDWRDKVIAYLINDYKLFIDKPLIKTQIELERYKGFIQSKKIMSSSMLMHDPQFNNIEHKEDLKKINVSYIGDWENYSSHAVDPVIKIISNQKKINVYKYKKSLFIKNENIEIFFFKDKQTKPCFQYEFIYKNDQKVKIKIDSNFQSFRNGLIFLKNCLLYNKIYRDLNDYESALNFYEAFNK